MYCLVLMSKMTSSNNVQTFRFWPLILSPLLKWIRVSWRNGQFKIWFSGREDTR